MTINNEDSEMTSKTNLFDKTKAISIKIIIINRDATYQFVPFYVKCNTYTKSTYHRLVKCHPFVTSTCFKYCKQNATAVL